MATGHTRDQISFGLVQVRVDHLVGSVPLPTGTEVEARI